MAFLFKVKIKHITKPPVWRRIVVAADATFYDLHLAIQGAFGWQNQHQYRFSDQEYRGKLNIGEPDEEMDTWPDCPMADANTTYISHLFVDERKKLLYLYDFGDEWWHEIVWEKTVDEPEGMALCTDGKGSCPPEDCGGPAGYEAFKKIFRYDPNGKEAKYYRNWLDMERGEAWAPNQFQPDEAQTRINRLFRYNHLAFETHLFESFEAISLDIERGLTCYMNPDTLEHAALHHSLEYKGPIDPSDREAYDRIRSWPTAICITPMPPKFRKEIMRNFVTDTGIFENDPTMSSALLTALSDSNPIRHFASIIANSGYREAWENFFKSSLFSYISFQLQLDEP